MSESIQIDPETCAALESLKRDQETFDELLTRLLGSHRRDVYAGAGLLEGTDAAERARERRREMKRESGRG